MGWLLGWVLFLGLVLEPVVSSSVAAAAAVAVVAAAESATAAVDLLVVSVPLAFVSPICQLHGAVTWICRGLAFVVIVLSMSSSGSLLSEDSS